MAADVQEMHGRRLVPLLNLISGVLEEYTLSGLTHEDADLLTRSDDDLVTLAVMQRLAFRAAAHKREQSTNTVSQTPRLNADFEEVL